MDRPALLGGAPAKTKPFPPWPQYDDAERKALLDVLESRVWWRTPGTQTLAFEQEFAAYQQARHGIAVTNGTHTREQLEAHPHTHLIASLNDLPALVRACG